MTPTNPDALTGVPDGWRTLVSELLAQLAEREPLVEVVAVTEHQGVLAVDAALENMTPRAIAIINRAESASAAICRVCGGPGVLYRSPSGRPATLCPAHAVLDGMTYAVVPQHCTECGRPAPLRRNRTGWTRSLCDADADFGGWAWESIAGE